MNKIATSDPTTVRYQIAEKDAAKRVAELSALPVGIANDDVSLCRYLIEQHAIDKPHIAERLLKTLSGLTSSQIANQKATNQLLPRSYAMSLIRSFTAVVEETYRDLPDATDRIDLVCIGVAKVIENLDKEQE